MNLKFLAQWKIYTDRWGEQSHPMTRMLRQWKRLKALWDQISHGSRPVAEPVKVLAYHACVFFGVYMTELETGFNCLEY